LFRSATLIRDDSEEVTLRIILRPISQEIRGIIYSGGYEYPEEREVI
jgi:hypothetical protein